MKIRQKYHRRGFTLIELMVVIAILGILAAIGLGAYFQAQIKARDARRKNDLKAVTSALEAYYNDAGAYPSSSAGSILITGCASASDVCKWGDTMKDAAGTSYMTELPRDPKTNWSYCYITPDSGKSYLLFARIENTQDSLVAVSGGKAGFYPTNTYGGTLACSDQSIKYNYVVTSSNIKAPTPQQE